MIAPHVEQILGGTVEENSAMIRGILDGDITGPRRDVVLLNAAAALMAAERAGDMREGIELARTAIDNGSARQRLERMVAASRE